MMEVVPSTTGGPSNGRSPSRAGGTGGSAPAATNSNGDPGPSVPPTVPILPNTTTLIGTKVEEEKLPQWQLDLMMEKLRQKSIQFKPLAETSKNIRQALMERRCIIDQGEKSNLQKSLDSLQQSIKVNSLQSMVERLEMVARQLGLKFTPGATGHEWFISSDMFYLELLIDPDGVVQDVKIQHDGKTEQQSCPEIVESLKRTDFIDFTAHLEGLVSIYQLNADKKIKSKAYIALQALENDLTTIAGTYAHVTDGEAVVMKSLLGLLQPRKGGHPVKLVYFVSPYEFLDVKNKSTLPNEVSTVLRNKLGTVATVNIQASTSHKLQMSSTLNVIRTPDGKSIPQHLPLNATNSTTLPACFMVNLEKPIPICVDLLKTIQSKTGIDCFDFSNPEPILNLVSHHVSNGTLNCAKNNGLYVALPDQVHCYYMTETPHLEGVMISTISFTLASDVQKIISILRQQLTFNTLVASCVRIGSKPEADSIVFEVNALSHQNLSVSFQHPLDDSLVTLEFDLRDVTHPHVRLHAVANATDIIPTLEEHACRVVQRSMSIPITLRAVIRRWQTMKVKMEPPNPDFSVGVGGSNLNVDLSHMSDRSCGAESGERRSNTGQQNVVVPPGIMNFNTSSVNNQPSTTGIKPQTTSSSSYSISPVNFPSQPPQNPMDILSYMNMNPFLNLQSQLSMTAAASFPNMTPNMAIQMLASQMGQNATGAPTPMLMGLLDQVNQSGKRRKRKNTTDNLPSQQINAQPSMRPNQSPSRSNLNQKSPIRRQSDSSDGSGTTEKHAINILMSELGMDQLPDSRWNIDITPVGASTQESADDVDGLKKQGNKKPGPKRSVSLDSHSSEEVSGIQNLIENQDFKPLMTASLSITPVVPTTSNVNSLLASIRPGIEIIPLPNPVTIPTSITVTPILPKSGIGQNSTNEKPENKPKKSKERSGSTKRKMDGIEGDSKAAKIPFLDSKGRMSPNINMTKKPSSPSISNSPSKPIPASQGKPSVSTLKSVSVQSPKHPDNSYKPKTKKPNLKAIKNIANLSIPQLKAISPDFTMSPQIIKPDAQKPDLSKVDLKNINQGFIGNPAVNSFIAQAAGAIGAANATAPKPPLPQIAKKGGLAAIVDKLKSVLPSTDVQDKKEPVTTMSTKDYLKVSSAITNDVLQQKKALGSGVGTPNPEYMVKGGQGLKLTINKTKLKDPSKTPRPGTPGLKTPSGMKKVVPGMKPLSALSAKLASVTKKSTTPTKELKETSLTKPNTQSKTKDGKPRLESEDLTKKMFSPGAVGMFTTAPIFDPNKFQIPKKNRNNPNNGSSSSASSSVPTISSSSDSSNNKSSASSNNNSGSSSSKSSSAPILEINKERITPSTTPTPMEIDAPAPELVAETSCTTSSSSVTHRSEPPALIEVGISNISSSYSSGNKVPLAIPVPIIPEQVISSKPDSTSSVPQPSFETKKLEQPAPSGIIDAPPAEPSSSQGPNALGALLDFTSPESPDPLNCVENVGTPQNIPTTPLNPAASEESPKVVPLSASSTPPPAATSTPVPGGAPQLSQQQPLPQPEAMEVDLLPTEESQKEKSSVPNPFKTDTNSSTVAPLAASEKPALVVAEQSESNDSKVSDEKSKSPAEMPPPPPPPAETSVPPVNVPSVMSPAPIIPPSSPKPVASPLSGNLSSGNGPTVSIASVHIVHSPQPNSPALLRSPLVQASPAASPYAIDDDLMDEAVIGGMGK